MPHACSVFEAELYSLIPPRSAPMAATVFSIGIELPGGVAEAIPFRSTRSLFDADVVVFAPSIAAYSGYESYAGHRLVDESDSVALSRDLDHWCAELSAAIASGKTVFVFLNEPEEVCYHTGSRGVSGTGRSRVTTKHVAPISSFRCLPVQLQGLTPRTGTEISVMGDLGALAVLWREFGAAAKYEVYFDAEGVQPLLGTKKREKVVGAVVPHQSGGALFLLPPIQWDEEALTYSRGAKTYWRKEAVGFGSRLVAALVEVGEARRRIGRRSAVPLWVSAPDWHLPAEERVLADIARVDAEIAGLGERRQELDDELAAARELYGLLFETGAALEHSIRLALAELGFIATPFRSGDSEFDVIFTSAEGRFLGEAEGKDTKAVNIDKMSQLERNLQEDFARDEVTEFAKGVLFANANRLAPLAERDAFFTEKCISAARRLGVALVRTPDLFGPARYLAEHLDADFATRCRRAIFDSNGTVVVFPTPPATQLGR
jgi:hypothetical protein